MQNKTELWQQVKFKMNPLHKSKYKKFLKKKCQPIKWRESLVKKTKSRSKKVPSSNPATKSNLNRSGNIS